jgi:hypothetical protein
MKKNSLIRLIVFATTSLFFSGAYSQLSADRIASIGSSPSTFSSKTISSADADKMALESLKAVNTRIFTHFSKNFRNATDIRIRPEANHTQVSFKENGISNSVQYSKNGKWKYSLRTYDESKLSEATRNDVETAYPGFKVFGFVNEVDIYNKKAILVMIENKDSWKRIRVLHNEIDEYESYRKAK